MKKWATILILMTLLLELCSCSSKEPDTLPSKSSMATTSTSFDIATDSTLAATKESSSAELGKGMTANDYVTIEKTETKYGLIQIPQIDEEILVSEDVRLANDMFRSIRERVMERLEDCKNEWGEESYHDAVEPLCITRYTKNDSLLSITVKYIELYPYSTSLEFHMAVNIDVSTGKVLDPHNVIKTAGYTENEVRDALRCYANRFMFYEWEHYTLYACAEDGTIPDGFSDPSYAWQVQLDELTASYDTTVSPQGKPWDKLSCHPAVYAGEEGLEVCVSVPTAAGCGYYDTMICIGHNDSQTILLNPNTPFGQPFGRGAMRIDAAMEVVAQNLELDATYNGDIHYNFSAESMEIINNDEQVDLAYVFRVYTDEQDHITTVGWYAVGAYSGMQWEMDIISGKWIPIMNGTGLLPEEIYTVSHANRALATIWNEPGTYGLWASNPCTEVDLIAYDSEKNHYQTDCNTLVLFAIEDETLVSFENGAMEGDVFVSQSQLLSLTLDAGESVSVLLERTETPVQAITVSSADNVATYIIKHYAPDCMPKIEYITSNY